LAGGFGDALFFVGVVWLAGLVRFAGGFLVALAWLAGFRVFFFIVGVLEMPKGPERTPCAQWMYCGWPEVLGKAIPAPPRRRPRFMPRTRKAN
jgi:hypothetical protein